jgi:hypothetical protein
MKPPNPDQPSPAMKFIPAFRAAFLLVTLTLLLLAFSALAQTAQTHGASTGPTPEELKSDADVKSSPPTDGSVAGTRTEQNWPGPIMAPPKLVPFALEIRNGVILENGKDAGPATIGNILDYMKKRNPDFRAF